MSKYILFRNQAYAGELKKQTGGEISADENSLYGIIPKDGDIIIVDAHYKGNMSDLSGMKIVWKLQKYYCEDINVKFKILSWFNEGDKILEDKEDDLYSTRNVDFVQLPVSDVKLLTTF